MVELAQFLYRPPYDADCTVSIGNFGWSNLHVKRRPGEFHITALGDVFVSRSGEELNNIEPTKPKLGENMSGGQIVMRMRSLQFEKPYTFESKSRYGLRCLKSIAVPPYGMIEPISQRSLTLANPINVDKANHPSFEHNGKTIGIACFPLKLVICKPPFNLPPVGRK